MNLLLTCTPIPLWPDGVSRGHIQENKLNGVGFLLFQTKGP